MVPVVEHEELRAGRRDVGPALGLGREHVVPAGGGQAATQLEDVGALGVGELDAGGGVVGRGRDRARLAAQDERARTGRRPSPSS